MNLKIKRMLKYLYDKPPIVCFIIAITLNFILEILNRRSIITAFNYFITNPLSFLCSVLIIALTLAVGLFVKRKVFVFSIISSLWLILGITNFILLGYRTTPLSNVDFKIIKTAFKMIGIYLSLYQIILISILTLIIAICIIILWFKVPKQKIAFKSSFTIFTMLILSTALITNIGLHAQSISDDFSDLAEAYDDYGFVYCFSRTVFDNGIKEPDNYSKETIDNIISQLNLNDTEPEILPNIIAIQLESFFDVSYLKDTMYTNEYNPIPHFTQLRDDSISGFLTVPLFGSGTANTEFEILTGISIDYFGPGEFPYYTVAKESTCDSVAYTLKNYDYTTHAIHNNTGTFYDRNIVYPNLGFDTFTSLEYMYDVEYTDSGWAKDSILLQSISDCMNSTDGQDFVFAVSVQPHGSYPDDTESSAYEYYVNQIKEVDEFIAMLTGMLAESDEDTLLILYGDHLPALDFESDDVANGNLYQTEYVIWANYELPLIEDEDINSYELMAKVFDISNIDAGIILKARQENLSESDVLSLAYDMLYGENYLNVDRPMVDMRMGIHDIEIFGVYQIGDSIRIRGNNFNEYSIAYINDSERETVFIDSRTLIIPNRKINSNDIVYVGQISTNKVILSETNHYTYINHNEEE